MKLSTQQLALCTVYVLNTHTHTHKHRGQFTLTVVDVDGGRGVGSNVEELRDDLCLLLQLAKAGHQPTGERTRGLQVLQRRRGLKGLTLTS